MIIRSGCLCYYLCLTQDLVSLPFYKGPDSFIELMTKDMVPHHYKNIKTEGTERNIFMFIFFFDPQAWASGRAY